MAATTTLLGLLTPTQGTLSGTWGDSVNYGISDYVDIAIAGTLSFAGDGPVTLTNTTGSASGNGFTTTTAQYMVIRITGTLTTPKIITGPSYSKLYMVDNSATGSTVSFIRAGQTPAVSVAVGEKCFVYYNGTDYVKVASSVVATGTVTSVGGTGTVNGISLSGTVTTSGSLTLGGSLSGVDLTSQVTGILPIANGGTATATPSLVQGSGVTITGTWPNQTINATGTGGTVTAVSVVSANGLAGTSSGGATPALTLSTSVTGVLKGNGTAISAGTAGTDYVAPGTATTFTATQTFSGSSSAQAIVLNDAAEVATVSATAATGTINYDITTQSVLYFTTSASGNWTVNFRASSGTSLDTLMSTGQSMTVAFLVTQGGTAYYNSAVQVDGSSVTPKYQGGTAYTAGNANSIDVYMYTIIKTGSAAFTVFTSQTKFA